MPVVGFKGMVVGFGGGDHAAPCVSSVRVSVSHPALLHTLSHSRTGDGEEEDVHPHRRGASKGQHRRLLPRVM